MSTNLRDKELRRINCSKLWHPAFHPSELWIGPNWYGYRRFSVPSFSLSSLTGPANILLAESAMMSVEPSEEAIENFISFTSSSRKEAIDYLKVSKFRSLRRTKPVDLSLFS
jgi:hypothetical protein